MNKINTINTILLVVIVLFMALGFYLKPTVETPVGSVVSNEYISTTTGATGGLANGVLKSGRGALGPVIMTVAGAGYLKIYDATTTNVNLRTNKIATTGLPILFSGGANQAIGTYHFDETFYNGLLFEHIGAIGSTTIHFR